MGDHSFHLYWLQYSPPVHPAVNEYHDLSSGTVKVKHKEEEMGITLNMLASGEAAVSDISLPMLLCMHTHT